VAEAVGDIDWNRVWSQARGIADGLQAQLEQVDFAIVGRKIGDAFVDAVQVAIPAAKELAERVSNAVRAIDFEQLGRALGPALATAVVTAFVTLSDPAFWIRNWDLALAVAATVFRVRILGFAGKLLAPLGKAGGSIVLGIVSGIERASPRLAAAVLTALTALPRIAIRALSPLTGAVKSVFGQLGRLARFTITVLGIQAAINGIVRFAERVRDVFRDLSRSIGSALDRAWKAIQRGALNAALKIVEPFSHIPGFFGAKFRDAKEAIQQSLDDMETEAAATARSIQGSIDSIEGKRITVEIVTAVSPGEGRLGGGRDERPETVEGGSPIASASRAAASRAAQAAQAAAAVQAKAASAAAGAQKSASSAAKRAAAQAKRAAQQATDAFEDLLAGFDLNLDRAQQTRSLRDDLKVLNARKAALEQRIRISGATLDLERELFQTERDIAAAEQQRNELRRQRRQERQFEALGLTPEGQQRVPGVGALKKRLASLRDQVKGTVLDTGKTRSQLARIAKVLGGQFGAVGRDVRAAILAMFQEISGALDSGSGKVGQLTKTQSLNTKKIAEGLGLSPDQIRELRGRLSSFNTAGLALAGAGGGGDGGFVGRNPIVVESHTNLYVDGQKLTSVVTRNQQKTKRRNPPQKRGPNRGRT
jgi:hypothetical protein